MKKTIISILAFLLIFFSFSSFAEDNSKLDDSLIPANSLSISDLLPSNEIWGMTIDSFQQNHPGEYILSNVGNSPALLQKNVNIEGYNMNTYYVFSERKLSKITYFSTKASTNEARKKCISTLVKQMTALLGGADSSEKGITEWNYESSVIQIGSAKLKKYTGTDDHYACIIVKQKNSTENNPNPKESIKTDSASTSKNSILFRNIPWYEREDIVKQHVETVEDFVPASSNPVMKNTKINSWYQINGYDSNVSVNRGGVILNYKNIHISGYSADVELSFAYPMDSGKVTYDPASAKFYMAKYVFRKYEDMNAVYDDLKQKLTLIYGSPTEGYIKNTFNDSHFPKNAIWIATDGSLIWLVNYYSNSSCRYDNIKIFYSAPNASKYLKDLNLLIKKEIAEGEAARRKNNSNNYDGL